VVADAREQARIAKHTRAGQRFKVIDPGPLPTPNPAPVSQGISIGQAVARMFGRLPLTIRACLLRGLVCRRRSRPYVGLQVAAATLSR
jgi:hypothetical protein